MKNFDDSKLYFYFAIVTIVLALISGGISGYSKVFVEKKIVSLLSEDKDVDKAYKKAYIELRNPQLFALYEHFDGSADIIKKILPYFDAKIYHGHAMVPGETGDIMYLNQLLDRRQRGARIGFKSAIFLLILTAFSTIMFFVERKQAAA